jgi:hypothetical protein
MTAKKEWRPHFRRTWRSIVRVVTVGEPDPRETGRETRPTWEPPVGEYLTGGCLVFNIELGRRAAERRQAIFPKGELSSRFDSRPPRI